jgi:hypothetical protein
MPPGRSLSSGTRAGTRCVGHLDVRRQQQQAAVRRWRSAGVRDRWQRMMGEIEASWRQPRVYAVRVRRCMQRWSQRVAQIPLHAGSKLRRGDSDGPRRSIAPPHGVSRSAHAGFTPPPSRRTAAPLCTRPASSSSTRGPSGRGSGGRGSRGPCQEEAQRLEAQQSLRGLGEGHAWAGRLQGLGLGPQHIAQLVPLDHTPRLRSASRGLRGCHHASTTASVGHRR